MGIIISFRRWEVPLDGVFLDGQRLPDTNLTGDGLDSNPLTALIDTVSKYEAQGGIID